MPQEWETKRYTLEDIDENTTEFNGNSHKTDWIKILVSNCSWEIIETIKTEEGQSLLTKNQIEIMQRNLASKDLTELNKALDEMQTIIFNLITYLYSDLGIEEKGDTQESNLIQNIHDSGEMLQILDILAVVPPKIQEYVKILLKAEVHSLNHKKNPIEIVDKYITLFGITIVWILENSLKNTQKPGIELIKGFSLSSLDDNIQFYTIHDPEILDMEKKKFTEPVFMRKEGIKQVDIEAGLVFRHQTVDILAKKILKPLNTPINKIFLLVGAEGSGKTTFLRNLMSTYDGDSFCCSFNLSSCTTPPNWAKIYDSVVGKFSNYSYSRISPLFIFDELHLVENIDSMWENFIIPILKNTSFKGRILFSHRNSSSFHSKILEKYRGKMKSHINAIFLNNIYCIQRDTQYLVDLLTLFMQKKRNYAYKNIVKQDHSLHQLLYTLSDDMNISLLRNFLLSINWDEYPEFYEDKLQNWVHEFTLQELELSLSEEIDSEYEKYRITVLYLLSLGDMIDTPFSLADYYRILDTSSKTNDIFLILEELIEQGWLRKEFTLDEEPTFYYRFHRQVDAKRIFSVLSTEFESIKHSLKFPFTLQNSQDIFKFDWVKPQNELPNTFHWEDFGIFRTAPLLKLEPLHDEQNLEKYFVTPNIQEKIFDVGRLFGDRILLLGDYKIGKTSLKNRVIHLLKKDLDVHQLTINVTKIKEISGDDISESISKNIYKQWYKRLYKSYYDKDYRDDPIPIKFGDSEEYLDRLLVLYTKIFTDNPNKLSIIVFEANQLETEEEVLPFKIFAEIFQVVWENDFSEFLRSKLFILCIGNRSWISYFNIDQTKRFGVFPNWLLFEDWDIPKLQKMLEKRIQYALKPAYNHLIPKVVPQNLVNKLFDNNGRQISGWLMSFKEFLVEFNKDFDYYGRDISRFHQFLDLKYFSREEYTKLVDKHKIITLCNDLTKFRTRNNSAVFKDVIDIIGYVYREKSVHLDDFSLKLSSPKYTISEELILKRLTEQDEKPKQLPFRIKNSRIRLKKTLQKFLDEIYSRTKLKEPQEILFKYLGREKVAKKKKDTNLEYITDTSALLSHIAAFAKEKENPELEQFIFEIIDNQIAKILTKLEVLTNLTKAEDKNSVMLDIKRLIAQSNEFIFEIPIILFDLADDNIQDSFNGFVKKIWDPSDNYNWRWIQDIDPDSPVEFNETIRQFHKFCFNFDVVLSNYDQLDTYQKSSIIEELIKDVAAEAPIIFHDESSSGILWAIDGPNVHYLDIIRAEKYIRDHILQEDEEFEKIVCLKNSYQLPHNFYYPIFNRYQEAGFKVKFPDGSDKDEDVDEYFTYLMNNQFISHKYRVLIVGSVDKLAIRFLSQKLQEYPDIQVYIFGDGVSRLSWKKFDEYIGKEKLYEIFREFSLKHRMLGNDTYYGTLDVYPERKVKLEEGKLHVSYAEDGRDQKYKVDRHAPLPMEIGEFFSENRTYQVIFTPTSNNYVQLLHCAPIDERLLYEGYFWAIQENKEFLDEYDIDEFLKKNDFPFLVDLKNFLRDAINRRLLFDLLSKKFRDYMETHGIEGPSAELVEKFLGMFPPKLFPNVQIEYTDAFKADLKRIKPNKK
ncbi:MAG: hypothetical protein ACTSRE_15685 [Promethearchaeota archaeon]